MACFPEKIPSIDALRYVAQGNACRFRYSEPKVRRVLVDSFTASAIIRVYDAVNQANKEKLARMIAHSPERLHRVAGFAFSHTLGS
jgi:hypothetical protein